MGNLKYLQTLSLFVVGQDAGEQIKELGCLNQLSGELNIKNLENVRDQEEARSANLAIKGKINRLRFYWSRSAREVNHRNEEEVLEGLHPHQNLKSLTIYGFGGKKFPSWMSLFDNLIQIYLNSCDNCVQVPTLGHLPCLKALEIWGMGDVTCIGVEFYGMCSNVLFPSLRTLTIRDMSKLVEWKDALEVTSARVVFPCLEELTIVACPQLRSAPCHFPFLQKLQISGIYNTALERISGNLTTLKSAQIRHVSRLTFVPEQLFCTSLQSLEIIYCKELSYIPDTSQPLISLEELTIQGSPKLKCFPRIQGLRRLSIVECGFEVLTPQLQLCCSNITRLPEGSLKCLKSLEIGGYCEELDVFPSLNFIQHSHTTLEFLRLIGWAKLNSLPGEIQQFTALKTLIIDDFDGIEALPEWLGNLSSLKTLDIWDCSKLKERCAKESGAEWLKIKHIPNITIQYETIQGRR